MRKRSRPQKKFKKSQKPNKKHKMEIITKKKRNGIETPQKNVGPIRSWNPGKFRVASRHGSSPVQSLINNNKEIIN